VIEQRGDRARLIENRNDDRDERRVAHAVVRSLSARRIAGGQRGSAAT
jgi:hypothetical protein